MAADFLSTLKSSVVKKKKSSLTPLNTLLLNKLSEPLCVFVLTALRYTKQTFCIIAVVMPTLSAV